MKKGSGTTLVEVMVGVFLLSLISVPLYFLMKDASNKRALVASRDYAKQETNKVLKILENDLSQARKGSFKQKSDDVIEIKVRKPGNKESEDMGLSYLFVKPDLIRRFDGQEWLVSRYVDSFDVNTTPEAGRLVVSLKIKAAMDGVAEAEAPELSQEKLIVMREDSSEELDKFWRDVGDVNKFFATQGSIMAGVKADAKQLTQQFTGAYADMLKDIGKMTVGEILKVKDELLGALKDVKDSISGLDKDILDLSADALYDRNFLGGMSSSKKKKAKQVKEALAGMKTKGDMDWNKIKDIGGKGGLFSSGMKTDAIKKMFNAKAELFNSGQEIVGELDKFKKQTSDLTDLDLSSINRSTWGL